MSHDLFTDVVSPAVRVRSSSRYTLIVSIVVHALIVAAVVIVPLITTYAEPPVPDNEISYVMPAPMPSVPSPPPAQALHQVAPPVNHDAAPIQAPDGIKDEVPVQPAGDTAVGGLDLGPASTGAFSGSIGLGTNVAVPAPPTPPPPTKPVRPGGLIREPVKVKHVSPVYPPIAVTAHVSGRVVIDAIIGTDGTVREARVLSGSPLLNQAALDAVRQWRYSPTTLNGVPVPVIMTVRVTFTLQ